MSGECHSCGEHCLECRCNPLSKELDTFWLSKQDFKEEMKDSILDFMQDYESDFDTIEDVLEYTEQWVEDRYD